MKICILRFLSALLLVGLLLHALAGAHAEDLGTFEQQGDIGKTSHAGSVVFDAATRSYLVAGGGENMWFTNDAFHFVWRRVSGDFALQAGIEWLGSGGNAHRKACFMVRQTLAPDSAYIDVAVHGDGLTSLQYRDKTGALTHEVQASVLADETRWQRPATRHR